MILVWSNDLFFTAKNELTIINGHMTLDYSVKIMLKLIKRNENVAVSSLSCGILFYFWPLIVTTVNYTALIDN